MSAIAMTIKVTFLTTFLVLSISANPVDREEKDMKAYIKTLEDYKDSCQEEYSKSKNLLNFEDYTEHDQGCVLSCGYSKAGFMKNKKIDVEKTVAMMKLVEKYEKGTSFDEKKTDKFAEIYQKCANKVNAENIEDTCNLIVGLRRCVDEEQSKNQVKNK